MYVARPPVGIRRCVRGGGPMAPFFSIAGMSLRQLWQSTAACHDAPAELFYAPDNEQPKQRLIREDQAKAVCGGCAVARQCLEYALASRERHGVWGGMNEDERAAEWRRRV